MLFKMMSYTVGSLSRVFLNTSSFISSIGPVSSTVPKLIASRSFAISSNRGAAMAVEECSTKLDAKLDVKAVELDELVPILSTALRTNYRHVNVDVVDCPNLREVPFGMTGSGIGNRLRIAEVGGIPNLYPRRIKKMYNLKKVCETCEMPEAFVFGPGAGSFDVVGHNSELVADSNFIRDQRKIANKLCWVVPSAKGYAFSTTDSTDFEITANLAISDGCPARKVLRVCAAERTGQMNYAECIQRALAAHYGHELISLAGLFLLKNSPVQTHILPDYPSSPRKSNEKKDDWLQYMRYYEMNSPMVFASVIHSTETQHHKLRIEHTHGFSDNGDAGHYHIDLVPHLAHYEGYFAPAHAVYRIDLV